MDEHLTFHVLEYLFDPKNFLKVSKMIVNLRVFDPGSKSVLGLLTLDPRSVLGLNWSDGTEYGISSVTLDVFVQVHEVGIVCVWPRPGNGDR